MIVVVHVIAGAGVAHVASTTTLCNAPLASRRPGPGLVAFACLVGLLSHGLLDGLKHGYSIAAAPDIAGATVLAALWCIAVRPEFRLLFAAVIVSALLPDIIDHGAAILHWKAGFAVPVNARHVFPWHWSEGSGSLHPGGPGSPPDTARNLDAGRNRAVSLTNYMIVLITAVGCVLTSPWVFRFVRLPEY